MVVEGVTRVDANEPPSGLNFNIDPRRYGWGGFPR